MRVGEQEHEQEQDIGLMFPGTCRGIFTVSIVMDFFIPHDPAA